MSDSLSDGAGKVSDQVSDTPSDRLSDTLSDASFFTTPDAPEVQFLEPVQASMASDTLQISQVPKKIDTDTIGIYNGTIHTNLVQGA